MHMHRVENGAGYTDGFILPGASAAWIATGEWAGVGVGMLAARKRTLQDEDEH
jgi:hypothetical protein